MSPLPSVRYAHIGGSGTWAFPYPDGVLDGHPTLGVEVVDPEIRADTPAGPSPPFRLCRLTDRRTGAAREYLYVWMHGIDPERQADAPGRSLAASERVFHVLAEAGVERVFVDNSTGAVAPDLGPWDLVLVSDVIDLSGAVPQVIPPGLIRFRDGLCPRLREAVARSVEANLDHYRAAAGPGATPRVKRDGVYVHTPGPWFETPAEDLTYRRLGFDVVGKTAGPEFRLARLHRMCLAILSIVVNPAEGLGEFEHADLRAIYRRCGPAMARLVIDAIASADPAPRSASDADPCHCRDARTISLFGEFAPFARYRGAAHA
jgi:purine nucleoside phosphorylase